MTAGAGCPTCAWSTGPNGLPQLTPGEQDQEDEVHLKPEAPTAGERAAFRLLPLVLIGVAVLAGVILYSVFT